MRRRLNAMKRFMRIIAIVVLTVVVSANVVLVLPKPAQAQFVVSVPNLESMSIREWIMDTLKGLLKTVLFQGLMNALTYFTQKLAYDAAVWMASGGKGQGTLFEYKNWGDYMKDVALDTAAEAIGTLSEEEGWPIDLCQPAATDVTGMLGGAIEDLTPQITANLQLGLADTYEPRPRCEWNQIASSWDEFLSSNTSDQILSQFSSSMRPGEDGLGSALKLFEKVSSESAKKEQAAVESRQEGKGVKSVETKVSGNVETPSAIVGKQFEQKVIDEPAKGQEQKVSGSLSISDSVLSMGMNVGSMFLNTLTSKLFSNLMGGFFDAGELVSEKKSLWDLGSSSEPEGGRIAAEKIFADLLKPTFLEITNWNPLMEYTTCPPERGTNNCALDSSFSAALTEAAAGNPISVRDAIAKGYLRGDWPLIPLMDRSRSQDPNCYNYGYCAVNLAKLRKARIIPVGWEIATNLAENNASSPITLSEVIARFNDSTSPYYHLIDPNWVLKMPATQCKMKVNGPTLASSEGDMRESVCVDTPSCLAEGPDGKCLGAWGYCTREKNVWRIKADSCPAEFSSCEGLTTRDKKKVAYLRNTMDYSGCNADNVGCTWYSTEKTPGASWTADKRIYLNKNVTECKATAAGCSDLIRKGRGVGANLVINSSFEKDENTDNAPDGWTLAGTDAVKYDTIGINSFHGTDAARLLRNGSSYSQNLALKAGTYVVSFYAKQETDSDASRANLYLSSERENPLDVVILDGLANNDCGLFGEALVLRSDMGNNYTRKSCVFNLNSDGSAVITLQTAGTGSFFIDAVQLEEGVAVTDYRETGYPWNVERVTMKIPPAYLGCTGGTDDSPECADYAQFCAAENIGCNLFTPTNGEPAVSAKVSQEDFCPSECSGYALFRQESTNFERANPAVYLIPKGAKLCSSDSAGCAEFTDTATGATSYYSFLRRCGTEGGASYYTWEGSDTTGYQIKSWSLLEGSPRGSEVGTPPAYQPGFADYTACTAAIFRFGTNPDCREFYDEAGNISYRLYSQTVVITPECKSLRKTLASGSITEQQSDCIASGGTWPEIGGDINQSNGCLYNGYGAESKVCGAGENGCRAYGGNASRNVYVAFEENFESGSITGWGQAVKVSLSAESMQVGGHSLKADGASGIWKELKNLHKGGIYTLSFWAKGPTGEKLQVFFGTIGGGAGPYPTFSSAENPKVNLATEWRLYNLGPVYFDREPGIDALFFRSISGAMTNIYLDNIILREVNQNIYLIKNSWTIPASCDRTIRGEILPQAMVGCQEYKDPQKNLRYLKSFGSLCPENAAGCEAFIDTKNNETTFKEDWNAVCTSGAIVSAEGGVDCVVAGKTHCHIKKGERRCYFKAVNEAITSNCSSVVASLGNMKICYKDSTFTVPADTTVYLVNDSKKYCASDDVGCVKVGKPALTRGDDEDESSAKYEDKILKIRPSLFDAILCKENELWCEEFKRESGGAIYAKNPGERLCEYKENVVIGGVEQSGWFKKGSDPLESCSYRSYLNSAGVAVKTNENFRIWKNDDNYYRYWVGVCEKKYSGCTTLVDPSDVSDDSPQGNPYYVIRNEELDEKSCKGKVSKTEGCVLFKDLNDPSVKYRADSTYFRSRDEASGGSVTAVNCPADETYCQRRCNWSQQTGDFTVWGHGLSHACKTDSDCQDVNPTNLERDPDNYPEAPRGTFSVSCAATTSAGNLQNDSNLIIKVTPDRECGEWLDCRSTVTVWDEAGGKYKKVCAAVDLCREYKKIGENESKCVKFVEGDMDDKVLNSVNYKNRDVSWSGMEYSGYSLPNKYQINDLRVVNVARSNEPKDIRLAKVLGKCSTSNGEVCSGDDTALGLSGKCYNGLCIRGIDNSIPQSDLSSKRTKTTVAARTCRAYPEQTSPFPPTIAEWDRYLDKETKGALSMKKQGYANASVCEQSVWLDGDADNIVDDGELKPQNCECSYQKAAYGRGTLIKYFNYNQEFLPEGICFGGPRDGLQCAPGVEDVCGTVAEGGTCERITRADKYLGLEGYCVEYDYSKPINGAKDEYPCLTWRQVEIPEGGQDVYNQYQAAGYNPPSAGVGKYFCLMGKGNALTYFPNAAYDDTVLKKTTLTRIENYLMPRYNVKTADLEVKTDNNNYSEYKEAIFRNDYTSYYVNGDEIPSTTYRDLPSHHWPKNKEDIAAINFYLQGYSGIADATSIFTENKGNILSRNGKHNGKFTAPDGEEYTFWEVRFPDKKDDGIADWESGDITYKSQRPLFTAPWWGLTGFGDVEKELSYEGVDGFPVSCNDTADINPKIGKWGNYFGIRAYFNDKDEFMGIWVSLCDNANGGNGITFNVEFLLAEPCVYLAEVVSANGENTARTNEIWEQNTSMEIGTGDYKYNQINAPFGSAASGFKSPVSSKEPWFLGVGGANGSKYFTDAYFPKSAVDAGSPLACRTGAMANIVPQDASPKFAGNLYRYGCFIEDTKNRLGSSIGDAQTELKKLFAKTYKVYSWDFHNRAGNNFPVYKLASTSTQDIYGISYGISDNVPVGWDERDSGKKVGIIAPSENNPQKSDSNSYPFAINNKINGLIDGGSENFEAIIKFYGWADKNQMPIVSRWVEWGDGTAAEKHGGKYKNHKPICASAPTGTVKECSANFAGTDSTGLTCVEDEDCPSRAAGFGYGCKDFGLSFGNSPEACEEGMFEFSHTYVCNQNVLSSLSSCPLPNCGGDPDCSLPLGATCLSNPEWCDPVPCKTIKDNQEVCVFRPRVRIKDNWGWCTNGYGSNCDVEVSTGLPIYSQEEKFRGVIVVSP